jgi:hypothetical protein
MKNWTKDFDMSTIPEEVFRSEAGRRSSAMRKNPSGAGPVWTKHSPTAGLRCRCVQCNLKRQKRNAE